MNKKNFIMWIVAGVIAIALLIFISSVIFSGNNALNEGKFRITDAILTSTAVVEDVNDDTAKWEINVSQSNRLSLLIQGMDGAKISKIEIDKMKLLQKPKIGTIYISEPRTKETQNIQKAGSESVAIYIEKNEDGSNIVELDILNKDIIKSLVIAEGTKEIRHDGTLISLANKNINDIKFKVSFSLNITSTEGKVSKCNISLELPDKSLIDNGQVVTRLSLSDFKFKI